MGLAHFTYPLSQSRPSTISYCDIGDAALENLHDVLMHHDRSLLPTLYHQQLRFLQHRIGLPLAAADSQLARVVVDRIRHDRYEPRLSHQTNRAA